jgi:hypothetical protein
VPDISSFCIKYCWRKADSVSVVTTLALATTLAGFAEVEVGDGDSESNGSTLTASLAARGNESNEKNRIADEAVNIFILITLI